MSKRPRAKPDPERAQEQLEALLARHKLTVPFPVDGEAFVRSLLPPMHSSAPSPEQLSNLNLAMSMRQFVHVSLDEIKDFDSANYENVFWLRVPNDVPTPPDLLQPYRLWPGHRQWKEVSTWFATATALDNVLDNLKDGFNEYFKIVTSAAELRVSWPELTRFVKLRGPLMGHIPVEQKHAIEIVLRNHIDADFRKLAVQMLAAATLLDAEMEPTAWVSFHTE